MWSKEVPVDSKQDKRLGEGWYGVGWYGVGFWAAGYRGQIRVAFYYKSCSIELKFPEMKI